MFWLIGDWFLKDSKKRKIDFMNELLKTLRENTGCGLKECSDALIYANQDYKIAVAYLKAKSYAVAIYYAGTKTPLSFDDRVKAFLELESAN